MNLREAFRREPRLKPFAIGLGIFAAATVAIAAKAISLPATSANLVDGFWISLSASFIEDLIFFVLVGAVGVYLSLHKPSDDVFDSRIKYLFNASRVNEKLRQHLFGDVEKLGIFSDSYKTNIEFLEYSPEFDAVKTSVHVERRLVNMFLDRPLNNQLQRIAVISDEIGNHDTVQGQLYACWSGTGTSDEHHISFPTDIVGKSLRRELYINIPANGEVTFNYRFWIWYKNGAEYSAEVLRYSETTDVRVENKLDQTLRLSNVENGVHDLTPGSFHLYQLGQLAAGGLVAFRMELPMTKSPGSAA